MRSLPLLVALIGVALSTPHDYGYRSRSPAITYSTGGGYHQQVEPAREVVIVSSKQYAAPAARARAPAPAYAPNDLYSYTNSYNSLAYAAAPNIAYAHALQPVLSEPQRSGRLLGIGGLCTGVSDGYFPDGNCGYYHQCSNGYDYLMPCPYGLHWSQQYLRCLYPSQSDCGKVVVVEPAYSTVVASPSYGSYGYSYLEQQRPVARSYTYRS